jgi:hypothetical protein
MVITAESKLGSPRSMEYQANDKGQAEEICRNGLIGIEPKDWHLQMREVERQNTRTEKYRLGIIISPPKQYGDNLTKSEWEALAKDYMQKQGINIDNHQYIAHLHHSTDDKHLHLTISRIDFTGKNAINDSNIGIKAGKIGEKMSKERNWKTAKEIGAERKKGLKNMLLEESRTSKNFEELSTKMEKKGFIFQISRNEARGVYGARLIKEEDLKKEVKDKSKGAPIGFKLSELGLKINELNQIFEKNKKKEEEERQAQNQEKILAQEKLEQLKEQEEQEPRRNQGFRR